MNDHVQNTTSTDARRKPRNGEPAVRRYLYVVIEAERPLSGGARYDLEGVVEIAVKRGQARSVTRESLAEGASRLTLYSPSRYLSREHARVVLTTQGWVIQDLESRNGTFVNGKEIRRALLKVGDYFDVGRVFCTIMEAPVGEGETEPGLLRDADASEPDSSPPGMLTLVPEYAAKLAELRTMARGERIITLVGETGSGKEVLGRAIHSLSRPDGVYNAINCGAIATELVESELFGHVKGSFSGSRGDGPGHFRASHNGTLMLDEIISSSPRFQTALLRVLQEKNVLPVGATKTVPVSVRVLAATQEPLDDAVERGRMRSDLSGRLKGYVFSIPPLRDRRVDLGLLVAFILRKHGLTEADTPTLTPGAALRILRFDWPLNIRELEQTLLAAWQLARKGEMRERDFPEPPEEVVEADRSPEAEKARIIEGLQETRGHVDNTAKRLKVNRPQLYRMMKRHQIDPDDFRPDAGASDKDQSSQ